MQRLDLFGPSDEGACRIAAAVVEFDYVIESRGLSVAKIRSGLGDLAQSLGPPEPIRDRLLAEVAVAGGRWIVGEMAVHVEVAVGDGGIADQLLIESAPDFG